MRQAIWVLGPSVADICAGSEERVKNVGSQPFSVTTGCRCLHELYWTIAPLTLDQPIRQRTKHTTAVLLYSNKGHFNYSFVI